MSLGFEYDPNNFRNEFPDHKNLDTDSLMEIVCAIVCFKNMLGI